MSILPAGIHPLVVDDAFQPLMDHVIGATGLDYYAQRGREFACHVSTRLRTLSLRDCRVYLRLLRSGPAGQQELDHLISLLTIGETHFFRHRELFAAIEHTLLPDLIERNRAGRRLRIWSAGCSTGAEAYSISILIRLRFGDALRGWDIRILGTDINRDFLARATAGRFEDWALRSLSAEERSECFTPCDGRWALKPQFHRDVSFAYHNLATEPCPPSGVDDGGVDLLLCRNVMIYFATEAVLRSVERFHDALKPGGWLLVGHAEHNIEWFRRFRTVTSHGAVLYQKRPLQAAAAVAGPVERAIVADPAVAPWVSLSAPRVAEAPAIDEGTISTDDDALQQIRSLADQGDLKAALRCCETSLEADGLNALLHLYHGMLLHQLNRQAAAEQSLRRAVYLDRNCLLAHYYLGLLWQQQGERLRAADAFGRVAQLVSRMPAQVPIPHADGMTAGDLHPLVTRHLAELEAR